MANKQYEELTGHLFLMTAMITGALESYIIAITALAGALAWFLIANFTN